jgi:hypothetical protein
LSFDISTDLNVIAVIIYQQKRKKKKKVLMYQNVVHGHVQDNLMKHVVVIFVIQSMLSIVLHERILVSILEKDQ